MLDFESPLFYALILIVVLIAGALLIPMLLAQRHRRTHSRNEIERLTLQRAEMERWGRHEAELRQDGTIDRPDKGDGAT